MTTASGSRTRTTTAKSPKARAPYQSVNPYNDQILQTFEELSAAQLERKLKIAAAGYETWRRLTYRQRAKIALKAAGLLRAQLDR